MTKRMSVMILSIVLIINCGAIKERDASPFRKDNLTAWCIVPFDAKKRSPEERAQMLARLGITRLAYDWRKEHIPTFSREIISLRQYGIRLQSVWLPCSIREPLQNPDVRTLLDLLRHHDIQTQFWVSLRMGSMEDSSQEERVEAASEAIRCVAEEAASMGCSVGLYNHGGWFGRPENQIAIIKRLGMDNVGIVYNFHHGHEDIDRFTELFTKMKPYLIGLNLNGMKKNGPMILPLHQGDQELGMLEFVLESGYKGPIGILDHRQELDAEVSLQKNLTGLQQLLLEMHDTDALDTY